jgi:hypothetical protein
MRIKFQDSPLEFRRRVANKLESIRGTDLAPGGKNARLGDSVCPIYRLDIKEVAYWEYEITGLKKIKAREHEGKSSGTGFILASAGGHDVPIPHFSLTTEPPSRALEAKSKQGQVARIVKLDTLAYAAEDENGEYLIHVGQMPLQIQRLGGDLAKYPGVSTVTATPKQPSDNDKTNSELIIKAEGAEVPKLKLVGWEDYAALRKGFVKAYAPYLRALADHASKSWEIENLITKFGEGIQEGQKLTVPLLTQGKIKVSGDGTKFFKLKKLARKPGAFTLEALPSTEKKEAGIQVEISYADGTSETLPFFAVPTNTPSNNRSILPHFVIKN